jgi:K+-sensing histidine kinase KdpD
MDPFPKGFQPRIFEGFFRIPGTKERTGFGLGHATARAMVVSHRGSIGSGPENVGSEFYFDLPMAGNGVKA